LEQDWSSLALGFAGILLLVNFGDDAIVVGLKWLFWRLQLVLDPGFFVEPFWIITTTLWLTILSSTQHSVFFMGSLVIGSLTLLSYLVPFLRFIRVAVTPNPVTPIVEDPVIPVVAAIKPMVESQLIWQTPHRAPKDIRFKV
jgi:hypothetical protein